MRKLFFSRAHILSAYLVFSILCIFALSFYSYKFFDSKMYPSSDSYVRNPLLYKGRDIVIFGNIESVEKGSFVMRTGNNHVTIFTSAHDITNVDDVTDDEKIRPAIFGYTNVLGKIGGDGRIALSELRTYDYMSIKYVVSFLAFIFCLFTLNKEWLFDKRKKMLVERHA